MSIRVGHHIWVCLYSTLCDACRILHTISEGGVDEAFCVVYCFVSVPEFQGWNFGTAFSLIFHSSRIPSPRVYWSMNHERTSLSSYFGVPPLHTVWCRLHFAHYIRGGGDKAFGTVYWFASVPEPRDWNYGSVFSRACTLHCTLYPRVYLSMIHEYTSQSSYLGVPLLLAV